MSEAGVDARDEEQGQGSSTSGCLGLSCGAPQDFNTSLQMQYRAQHHPDASVAVQVNTQGDCSGRSLAKAFGPWHGTPLMHMQLRCAVPMLRMCSSAGVSMLATVHSHGLRLA